MINEFGSLHFLHEEEKIQSVQKKTLVGFMSG